MAKLLTGYIYKITNNNGYNSTLGGEGLGGNSPSKETKLKISNSLKGHTDSKETRKRKSIAKIGIKKTEECKENCRIAFRNRSEESENYRKQRIREVNTGKKMPEKSVRIMAEKHKIWLYLEI